MLFESMRNEDKMSYLCEQILSMGGGVKLGDEDVSDDNPIPVNIVEGNVTLNVQDIQIGAVELKDGATDIRVKIKTDGTDNAVVVIQNSSPLPTGASTAANQSTGNTTLSTISSILSSGIAVNFSKSSSANTPSILTSAGDVLAANANRKTWRIQNLGTNPIFVRLGTSASTSVFHVLLTGGIIADDGQGGAFEDDIWTGIVSITGTTPRCVVTELS